MSLPPNPDTAETATSMGEDFSGLRIEVLSSPIGNLSYPKISPSDAVGSLSSRHDAGVVREGCASEKTSEKPLQDRPSWSQHTAEVKTTREERYLHGTVTTLLCAS